MAQTLLVLGQNAPGATSESDLYTVPAATTAAVSSVVICNRGAETTFRISVSVNGAATANKDYLYYDTIVPANETYVATIGITMGDTDKIRVYAGSANVSFSAFGSENT
jgi:hypothetical protein